jgi:hypothetical protein
VFRASEINFCALLMVVTYDSFCPTTENICSHGNTLIKEGFLKQKTTGEG